MQLSIIINHYRTPDLLKVCLRSLKEHLTIPAEVLVVDSAVLPETKEMLREYFPDVTHIPFAENVGFAKSVNAGIAAAQTPFIFIVNADLVFTSGLVETLLKIAQDHKDAALLGPRLMGFDGSFQPSAFRFYTPATILARRTPLGRTRWGRNVLRRFLLEDVSVNEKKEVVPVDWIMGSAMFLRKEAIDQVGLLDDRFFMYFEDVDWCRRFWESGWKVYYVPQATAYHFHKRASRGRGSLPVLLNRYTRIHLVSAMKYFAKHGLKTPRYGV